jgi:hypothetical protein
MKSPIGKAAKIGTVAGLAALAASEAANAAVVASSISMVDLSVAPDSTIAFDIDGNGTTDFQIWGDRFDVANTALYFTTPNGSLTRIIGSGSVVTPLAGGFQLANGALLPNGSMFESWSELYFPAGGNSAGEFYAGVQFSRNGELHYGWLQFDLPTDGTLNGATLVSAAWNDEAYGSVTLGAVPEPSALMLAFAGAAAGLVVRRRFA